MEGQEQESRRDRHAWISATFGIPTLPHVASAWAHAVSVGLGSDEMQGKSGISCPSQLLVSSKPPCSAALTSPVRPGGQQALGSRLFQHATPDLGQRALHQKATDDVVQVLLRRGGQHLAERHYGQSHAGHLCAKRPLSTDANTRRTGAVYTVYSMAHGRRRAESHAVTHPSLEFKDSQTTTLLTEPLHQIKTHLIMCVRCRREDVVKVYCSCAEVHLTDSARLTRSTHSPLLQSHSS